MPAPLPPPVGVHVPVGGGLARRGLAYAGAVGARAVQVFVGNPRGWATPAGDPAQDRAFRDRCAEDGTAAYVHTPYLVNLGSPTAATLERSVVAVRHGLARGRAIGARGVVVHTGSAVGEGAYEAALAQVREHLLPVLDALEDGGPQLLLEPTAGQGRSLCATVEDLGPYLDALGHHPRVGVCLDTCHVFAAGHDLAAPGGMAATLDRVVEVAGPGRLALVHANDSLDVCGSSRDRHERIGKGHIGEAPFSDLLRHPAVQGVPVVLETPGGEAEHTEDIALLVRLRDG